MQDGRFSLPPVTIGLDPASFLNAQTANQDIGRGMRPPEYAPLTGSPYLPTQVLPDEGINVNPDLYEDITIANQSGFTNWWNQTVNAWNDTQIGMGAADLMDGLVKKANLQNRLNQLEADYISGMPEAEYLQQKSQILTELNATYNNISSARA